MVSQLDLCDYAGLLRAVALLQLLVLRGVDFLGSSVFSFLVRLLLCKRFYRRRNGSLLGLPDLHAEDRLVEYFEVRTAKRFVLFFAKRALGRRRGNVANN